MNSVELGSEYRFTILLLYEMLLRMSRYTLSPPSGAKLVFNFTNQLELG
ncbi:hypothetical protein Aazo_5306 (plasmid) ['Nostoc azollae' 0708]|jgi:hypothetical protein|uniref:Uncharacterized protein n=1 Tax=Nostoc azollae (strain 0708) TaxID=551115 RepID=D7E5N8_NOSA0|nr:hypothetical protein Aazo_5306 ['Nostoc azollae' 0708]